ncbi:hypothetical protein MRX96_055145 [Rhipicephalus microplus]
MSSYELPPERERGNARSQDSRSATQPAIAEHIKLHCRHTGIPPVTRVRAAEPANSVVRRLPSEGEHTAGPSA